MKQNDASAAIQQQQAALLADLAAKQGLFDHDRCHRDRSAHLRRDPDGSLRRRALA